MSQATTSALQQIIDLEAERAALYARAAERRPLDVREIERLYTIRRELAQLWDVRQREKAGAPEGSLPDNLRNEAAFAEGRHNRSRRRARPTWAEALLELEVG